MSERDFHAAERLRERGYFDRAAALYRKVLKSPARRDPELWIESCLGLASVHRSLGSAPQARKLLQRGARLAAELGTGEYRQRFALEDALVDRAEGLYAKSLEKLGAFLRRFQREEDWAGVGFVLWAMGGARRFSGDLKGAEHDFHSSLSAARRAKDISGQVYALFGLGGVTRIAGRLEESRKYYSEAGRRLKGSDDVFGKAYAHCGLANALRQLGLWQEAQSHYERSHRLYSSLGDAVDLAYVDWGLGKIALHRGELARAEGRFGRALKGFAGGREQRGLALTEAALAGLEHARGKSAAADRLFARAYRRARSAGLRTYVEIFT
ncbi:MAG: tetratricopeptide repeat protein [Elusimicrobia bacterium]|nr:tetratricopeptide repeat protein [Elusimicrobiota bacterium]